MKRKLIYPLLLTCLVLHFSAQINKAKFQRDFSSASARNKVRMVASTQFSQLHEIYPFIKDTLEKIRHEIYHDPSEDNKDLKFLFDKIEAQKEMYAQNYGKVIFILENALHYSATNIDDSLTCLAMLKNVFVKIKNVNRAFEMQYMLENKWKRKSDTANIDFGLNESYLFHMLGLHTEALAERRKEFNARPNKGDTDIIVNFYNDMGVFFNQQKKSDSAEFYFLRARDLLARKKVDKGREMHYDFYKGLIDGNLGLSYYNRGETERALPLLKRDAYYSMKSDNFESAFNSYNIIVRCYMGLGQKQQAALYLDTCQALLKEKLPRTDVKIKLLLTQAEYAAFTGNYKRSSDYYKDYYRMNDSIQVLEKERETVNQGLTFSIEQREQAFEERERLLHLEETEQAKQKTYKITLLIGLLVLSVVILFLVANNRRARRREIQLSIKNKQIQEQNTQIEQSLKEKEALIKEIHHRVKNNLQIITSMLNLQIGKIDDEKTESIFFEARQRINAIALTHQMLYQKTTISNINLGEYIESLVKQIEASMSTAKIEIVTQLAATSQRLTIDGAVPLGLIINELLTNCYKHAFPQGKKGVITVSLIENPDTFTIKVSDNGVGLPEGFDQAESKTLGMELVYILVEQLDSNLIIENKNGSSFMFDIKKT